MSKHKHPPEHEAHAAVDPARAAHDPAHPPAVQSHGPSKADFITIFLILGFLTVVEVFVPQIYDAPWNQQTKMVLLCTLAVGKALLVALYFMHLKWERPWLKRIALMPAYMGIIAVLLMIETAWRHSVQ